MARPKKTQVEALEDVVETLKSMGFKSLAERVADLRHDIVREEVFSVSEDVYFVDVHTGEVVKVNNDAAKFARLKVEAPETYEFYKRKLLEFLAAFKDDSLFVKMYGRFGEKLFLEEKNESI